MDNNQNLPVCPEHRYRETGYVGPLQAIDPAAANLVATAVSKEVGGRIRVRRRYRRLLDSLLGRDDQIAKKYNRHFDWDIIRSLALNDSILAAAANILGANVALWRSQIFCQFASPDDGLPWHRDTYGNVLIDMNRQVSVQIALTRTTAANCLEIIPGTHNLTSVQLAERYGATVQTKDAQANSVRYSFPPMSFPTKAAMNAGEFILFHPGTIHRSSIDPESNSAPRMCITFRYTVPDNINKSKYPSVLVRGRSAPREGMLDWSAE
jgi:ectoine hydroxylase-related dioxygenase (phytanoyl-CoA dioxygenase family)